MSPTRTGPATISLVLLTVSVFGCSSGERDDSVGQRSERPLIGGEPTNCYPQTVRVESFAGYCTGVAIAPDLILTAAHCVVLAGGYTMPTMVHGQGGGSLVLETYVHPQYAKCQPPGTTFANAAGRDLAVIRTMGPAFQASPLAGPLPPVGSTLDAVGYGGPNSGERRKGSFHLDSVNTDGSLNVTGMGAGFCPGDSGAALFRPGACSGSPPPVIVGVLSSQPLGQTASGNCAVGNTSLAANVTNLPNAQFIASVLTGQAQPFDPTTQMPSCCTPGATQSCQYGTQTCGESGEWGPCMDGGSSGGSGDPCAGNADPCCGSADPCCGSSDPCCSSLDPCCGSQDPCCGSYDPCCGVQCEGGAYCMNGQCVGTDVCICGIDCPPGHCSCS